MLSTVVSVVAVVVALVSFVVNYRSAMAADRRGRMPVLVLFRTPTGIQLTNVDNGPALNIVVGLAEPEPSAARPVAPWNRCEQSGTRRLVNHPGSARRAMAALTPGQQGPDPARP